MLHVQINVLLQSYWLCGNCSWLCFPKCLSGGSIFQIIVVHINKIFYFKSIIQFINQKPNKQIVQAKSIMLNLLAK
jgi:hypothetical protein